MKRFAVALLVLAFSPAALAGLSCTAGKASARAFTEHRSAVRGQLDGLVIGADKAAVVAFLESQGVPAVEAVPEQEFWADKACVSDLEKLGNDGLVQLRGPNMRQLGTVELRAGLVSRVDSGLDEFFPGLAVGMPRAELVRAIAQALARDRKLSAASALACGSPRTCRFPVRELLGAGSAASEDAWRFLGADREHDYTVHFRNGLLVEASSTRWRGPAL